jgi:hypothetical protein
MGVNMSPLRGFGFISQGFYKDAAPTELGMEI